MIVLAAASVPEPVPNLPVVRHVATRMAAAARTDTDATFPDGTARRFHTVTSTARNPRIAFASLAGSPCTLAASLQVGEVVYQATFDGATSVAVAADTGVESDPIPVTIPAGTQVTTRIYTLRGTDWKGTWQGQLPNIAGEAQATGDLTPPGTPWVPAGEAGDSRGPLALYADTTTDHRCIAVVGDSISAGILGSSWTTDVVAASGIAWQSASVGGQAIGHIQIDRDRRFGPRKLAPFTHHLCQYGTNDMGDTTTDDTFPWASYIDYWTWAAGQGCKVIQSTSTPRSTTSDNWSTVTGQTPIALTIRTSFNTWLRDGAPLIHGAKADPGATGAVRAGEPGHPLHAVFDAAAAVESELGSGLWRVDKGAIQGDGLHPSAAGSALIAAAFPSFWAAM